jgi:hypothetical protein
MLGFLRKDLGILALAAWLRVVCKQHDAFLGLLRSGKRSVSCPQSISQVFVGSIPTTPNLLLKGFP